VPSVFWIFFEFLNDTLFVWPLFGLFLQSILPDTPYPRQSTKGYVLWGSRLYTPYQHHCLLGFQEVNVDETIMTSWVTLIKKLPKFQVRYGIIPCWLLEFLRRQGCSALWEMERLCFKSFIAIHRWYLHF
jgi:hypothetical protein